MLLCQSLTLMLLSRSYSDVLSQSHTLMWYYPSRIKLVTYWDVAHGKAVLRQNYENPVVVPAGQHRKADLLQNSELPALLFIVKFIFIRTWAFQRYQNVLCRLKTKIECEIIDKFVFGLTVVLLSLFTESLMLYRKTPTLLIIQFSNIHIDLSSIQFAGMHKIFIDGYQKTMENSNGIMALKTSAAVM